jgi:hypothetical protein
VSVYKAISAVQADLCKVGIGKTDENKFDNYKFRGIDSVYNVLSPLLAKHGLCMLPRIISQHREERATQKGGAIFYVVIEVEYDLVSEDGSKHTVRVPGEAMDRGDKSLNKAMSSAFKNAAFQTFAIPTEGDNDTENQTHEIQARPAPSTVKAALGDWPEKHPEEMEVLRDLAAELVEMVEGLGVEDPILGMQQGPEAAYRRVKSQNLDGDQNLALWSILQPNSKTRAALKKVARESMQ